MTTTPTSGAAIQRYKIGYHADDWGQRSSTPSGIPDASGSWVRYADHVTALAAGQATAAQQEAAYAALPDEREMLKHALWLASSFTVHRYLMSNAEGRWSGAEKAACHDELCCLYVAVFRGVEVDQVRFGLEADWMAVHDATQELTDHMDVVIGFPLKGVPDYEALAPKFFAYFHRLATHALRASHGQAPAETGNSVSAQADSVLYDPKAVLDVFNSARAGSDKSSGYLRGILAVIAHWESRPEPHRWMVPARADSVLEDALSDAVRVPLDSLHADAAYLIGRLREGSMPYARVIEIIRERIDAAKAAIRARAAHGQAPADAAPSAGAVAGPDDIDAIALTRYKVVHSHDSMFHRFAVVAGDGKQQLYLGRETECQNMTRKFAGAFLDGAFYQSQIAAAPTPAAQAADSVQEDAARKPLQIFDSPRAKALMRAFEEGWAACRDAEFVGEDAQNDAFNQSATVNVCLAEDWTAAAAERAARAPAESVTAPLPPPECETEAEKRAFAFGWFKALESERMKADNKKKDQL